MKAAVFYDSCGLQFHLSPTILFLLNSALYRENEIKTILIAIE